MAKLFFPCLVVLLAAPLDRRVFWFGHLVSTWPVVPGVVVQDGVAYAVAGFQKENGVHAYAFDPKSGNVLWEKDNAGSGWPAGPGAGYSNIGGSTVAGGKLWLCSSTSTPGSFELKSGDWKPAGASKTSCTRSAGSRSSGSARSILRKAPSSPTTRSPPRSRP